MKFLEDVIVFLQFKMKEPTIYSWFHIISLIIMVLIIWYLARKRPNTKKTVLILSIIMIAFEIYKQLSFSYSDNTWRYHWYSFPFQFCSVPMYVGLIAGLTKNKKLENSLYCFLATYGLIAGLAVMLYPITVFVEEVLINIQTMIHHGFMVVMGVYLLISKAVDYNIKSLVKALKVFMIFVLIALVINIVTHYIGIDNGLELFYISPFHKSILPVFSIIYDKVPYLVFLLLYISSFSLGAWLPLMLAKFLQGKKIGNEKNYKKMDKTIF